MRTSERSRRPSSRRALVTGEWFAETCRRSAASSSRRQQLLDELERALAYSKLRRRISSDDADAFVAFLAERAFVHELPASGSHHSPDPGDDYLLALAEHRNALLVSGDPHLLALAKELPILTARQFRERVDARTSRS